MQHIYSRVSTDKQDTDNQLHRLRSLYPSAQVHEEVGSSSQARPILKKLLANTLAQKDTLIVSSLDRLARKTLEALKIVDFLEKKDVFLISLREGVDYRTPAGKLVTQILFSVAEMERAMISERTKSALAAKRAVGIVGGRPRKYSDELRKEVVELHEMGLSLREIGKTVGMSHGNCGLIVNKDKVK